MKIIFRIPAGLADQIGPEGAAELPGQEFGLPGGGQAVVTSAEFCGDDLLLGLEVPDGPVHVTER